VNIITQIEPTKQDHGVYPLDHNYDLNKNIDQIQVLTWGVKWNLPVLFPHGKKKKIGRKTTSVGISVSAHKRLIKTTSSLEGLKAKVSHMITFTLPHQRWEEISDDQKATIWRTAKNKLLKGIEKLLSHYGKNVARFWFQEFQQKNGRGAPHLHVFIDIGRLSNEEWQNMLHSLIHVWQNSLNWNVSKDGEFPSQSVDFNRMRKRDFRYARKYSSKKEQKNAPFEANWGRWWGCGGVWKKVKPHDYPIPLKTSLSEDDQKALLKVFKNNTWLTWSLLRYRNKDLYKKLQELLLLPFNYSKMEGKHTTTEKMVFERMITVFDEAEDKHTTVKKMYFEREITENNKKDDMLFFKNTSSSFSSSIQIIPHPLLLCQEVIERSEEKAVQTRKQLTLDITLLKGL